MLYKKTLLYPLMRGAAAFRCMTRQVQNHQEISDECTFNMEVCGPFPLVCATQALADRHAVAVAELEADAERQKAALRKEAAGLAREASLAAEERAHRQHQTM